MQTEYSHGPAAAVSGGTGTKVDITARFTRLRTSTNLHKNARRAHGKKKKRKEKYMVSKSIAAALYELNSPFHPPQEDDYH